MNKHRIVVLLASSLLLSATAHAQEGFSTNLAECATSFNMTIDRNVSRSIEESVTGEAHLDLYTFMKVFPDDDRLDAYKIFSQCLVRRYKTTEAGAVINISKPKPIPNNFPDLTNK